jgi:asparagine synthase (glutamine-hydrolysing)
MWNEDRSVAIVFNGEIYNFRELRKTLEREGHRFNTQSDTEVALKLYETSGERAVSQLDGMFALAIWDGRKSRLLLARDRAGKKPLFYYQDDKRFAFGSEIKSLHAHPEIPRRPQFQALPFYLTYGYFPAPATAYVGIQQLPPASILTIDTKGELEQKRFWQPPCHPNGISGKDEAQARLRELMRDAVAKRLVADVPLGAFLSGGLDSTIVVGLMSRALSRPVRTFSIGFTGAHRAPCSSSRRSLWRFLGDSNLSRIPIGSETRDGRLEWRRRRRAVCRLRTFPRSGFVGTFAALGQTFRNRAGEPPSGAVPLVPSPSPSQAHAGSRRSAVRGTIPAVVQFLSQR